MVLQWEAVKGLDGIKSDLWEAVTGPEDFPNLYMNGEEVRNGVLLYGTPVTGKTFLAEVHISSCNNGRATCLCFNHTDCHL